MSPAAVDHSGILTQVEAVVASPALASSPRLVQFLRFCVERTLDGKAETLKETTIGVEVFGRDPGYDPKLDPIVRVHARRLRDKLDLYYRDVALLNEIVIRMPKGGYVPVFEAVPSPTPAPLAEFEILQPPVPSVVSRGHRGLLAAGLVVVLLIGVLIARVVTKTAGATAIAHAPEPLTTLRGSETQPSWSPDGRTLAFVWDNGGESLPAVYLQAAGTELPRKLTRSSDAEHRPVWSPDGRSVALLRAVAPNRFAVVIADSNTGNERIVFETSFSLWYLEPAPALDWWPDGSALLIGEQRLGRPAHLLRLDLASGQTRVLTDPVETSTGDVEARISPDGKLIAFRRGGLGELFVQSTSAGPAEAPRELTFHNVGVRGLAWSADSTTIYFGGHPSGPGFRIWRIPASGGTPEPVTSPAVEAVDPVLNPADHSLGFAQPARIAGLWRYALNDSAKPVRVTSTTKVDFGPSYSPDGSEIAFVSTRSGSHELWVANLGSGQLRRLTSFDGSAGLIAPAWSADGQRLSFFARIRGRNTAEEVPARGGEHREIAGGAEYLLQPQFSPDGRWIYYVSNVDHRYRVWNRRLDGMGSGLATTEDAAEFWLSADGTKLYYLRMAEHPQVVSKDLATNNDQVIWSCDCRLAGPMSWNIANGRLAYVSIDRPGSSDGDLFVTDLASKATRHVARFRLLNGTIAGLAISPDGSAAVVPQLESDDTDLMRARL